MKKVLFTVLASILGVLPVSACASGEPERSFPPPEGFPSWEAYYEDFYGKHQGSNMPTISMPSAPATSANSSRDPRYVYEGDAICVGGDGEPIALFNNPGATDPSYDELLSFIKLDPTDTHAYIEIGPLSGDSAYVCADFAEGVHNNAEASGIRAAWVGIDWLEDETGHALNAFNTTDRGLVYVDCTEGDSVAYVEIGSGYGRIEIDYAASPDYSFYEDYTQACREFRARLEAYNREVEQYNEEVSGKVYTEGSAELGRIEEWEASLNEENEALDELSEELGNSYYEQGDIVASVYTHW